VRRKDLGFIASDLSGLRSVQIGFGRRQRGRCRFLGRRAPSKPRSCRKPIYRRVATGLRKRLRSGSYVVYLKTRDGRGNKTKKPRRIYMRVRR
jgi:hypothetical protein